MANTYTTTINSMQTIATPTGFISNVMFTVSGTDGTHTATINGNCQFTPTSGATIVPFAQVTQAEVLAWINESTNNLANYYANIDGQIASIVTPPVTPQTVEFPWLAGTFTPGS